MFLFCGKTCSADYKKKNKVMAMCDYCKLQKIIKETVRFSGVDKPFCSEGKEKSSLLSTVCGGYEVIHDELAVNPQLIFKSFLLYEV